MNACGVSYDANNTSNSSGIGYSYNNHNYNNNDNYNNDNYNNNDATHNQTGPLGLSDSYPKRNRKYNSKPMNSNEFGAIGSGLPSNFLKYETEFRKKLLLNYKTSHDPMKSKIGKYLQVSFELDTVSMVLEYMGCEKDRGTHRNKQNSVDNLTSKASQIMNDTLSSGATSEDEYFNGMFSNNDINDLKNLISDEAPSGLPFWRRQSAAFEQNIYQSSSPSYSTPHKLGGHSTSVIIVEVV